MSRIARRYMANGAGCAWGEKNEIENRRPIVYCIYCLDGKTGNHSVRGGKEHMFHTLIGLWDLSV